MASLKGIARAWCFPATVFLLGALTAFPAGPSDAAPPADTGQDLMRLADESRGNLDGVVWNLEVESTEEDGDTSVMALRVSARGFDVLGETFTPAKYKGNKVLMVNHTEWFHRPGLSKPVPISRRQKLLGQASYGDIATTNYAEDYDAVRLADDAVDGEACYVFDLTSAAKWTTYDRIVYWISKSRNVGVQAEYFTVSGKKFKSARMEYGHEVMVNGENRPFISKMTISDELMTGRTTVLTFGPPIVRVLPDYIFNLNLLVR